MQSYDNLVELVERFGKDMPEVLAKDVGYTLKEAAVTKFEGKFLNTFLEESGSDKVTLRKELYSLQGQVNDSHISMADIMKQIKAQVEYNGITEH